MMTKGPTRNPFLADSLIVYVKRGPGTSAPENATRKEVENIPDTAKINCRFIF
jgi:hypothetical protein